MAELLNLTRVRKAAAKAQAKAQTAENRVKFGRGKSEKSLEAARTRKAARELEGRKRE